MNPATSDTMDKASCQKGTPPAGIRAIITMGDENGIMLAHTANGVSGFATAVLMIINDKIIGIVIGSIKD